MCNTFGLEYSSVIRICGNNSNLWLYCLSAEHGASAVGSDNRSVAKCQIHIRYCTAHPSYYTSYLYWGSDGSTAKWCEVNNASNLESFKFTLKLSSTISSWFAFLFLLFLLFLFSLSIIPFRLKCCRSSLSSIKSNSSSSFNRKQIKWNRKLIQNMKIEWTKIWLVNPKHLQNILHNSTFWNKHLT